MQPVTRETWVAFERRLERAAVPAPHRPDYHKWTRFYLDFCHKYGHPPRSRTSLAPFLSELAGKNQSAEQRNQAAHAIRLLLGPAGEPSLSPPVQAAEGPASTPATPRRQIQAFVRSRPTDQLGSNEVRGFLTELAVRHGVAASTQNQAFNALLSPSVALRRVGASKSAAANAVPPPSRLGTTAVDTR